VKRLTKSRGNTTKLRWRRTGTQGKKIPRKSFKRVNNEETYSCKGKDQARERKDKSTRDEGPQLGVLNKRRLNVPEGEARNKKTKVGEKGRIRNQQYAAQYSQDQSSIEWWAKEGDPSRQVERLGRESCVRNNLSVRVRTERFKRKGVWHIEAGEIGRK